MRVKDGEKTPKSKIKELQELRAILADLQDSPVRPKTPAMKTRSSPIKSSPRRSTASPRVTSSSKKNIERIFSQTCFASSSDHSSLQANRKNSPKKVKSSPLKEKFEKVPVIDLSSSSSSLASCSSAAEGKPKSVVASGSSKRKQTPGNDKLGDKEILNLLLTSSEDDDDSEDEIASLSKHSDGSTSGSDISPERLSNEVTKLKKSMLLDDEDIIICDKRFSRLIGSSCKRPSRISSNVEKRRSSVKADECSAHHPEKVRRSLASQWDDTSSVRKGSLPSSSSGLSLKRKATESLNGELRESKERRIESPGLSNSVEYESGRSLRCRKDLKLPKWRLNEEETSEGVWRPNSSSPRINLTSPVNGGSSPSSKSNGTEIKRSKKDVSDDNGISSKYKQLLDSADILQALYGPKENSKASRNVVDGSPSRRNSVRSLPIDKVDRSTPGKIDSAISISPVKNNCTVSSPVKKISSKQLGAYPIGSPVKELPQTVKKVTDATVLKVVDASSVYEKRRNSTNSPASKGEKAKGITPRKIHQSPVVTSDTSPKKVSDDNGVGSVTPKAYPSSAVDKKVKCMSQFVAISPLKKTSVEQRNGDIRPVSTAVRRLKLLDSKSGSKTRSDDRVDSSPNYSPVKRELSSHSVKKDRSASHRSSLSTLCSESPERNTLKTKPEEDKVKEDGIPRGSLKEARLQLMVSAVPKSLPCREKEFNNVYAFLSRKILDKAGGCMYISGVPGTGKTATVHAVVRKLQQEALEDELPMFNFVEINGLRLTEPRQAYIRILQSLTGQRLPSEQAQRALDKRFSGNEETPTVLVVDELDYLCNKRQDVVYNILDWPTRQSSGLVILTIANTMDLPERTLKGKVTSRMGLTRLSFQPYTHHQLQEIVMNRLAGNKSFHPDAVQLVARKVAAVSGDARRALDVCRRATELVNSSKTVTIQHVEQAVSQIFTGPRIMAIKGCTWMCQLILRSIRDEMLRTGMEETTVSHMYKHLVNICALEGVEKPTPGAVQSLCTTLESLGLVIAEKGRPDFARKLSLNVSCDDIHYALNC